MIFRISGVFGGTAFVSNFGGQNRVELPWAPGDHPRTPLPQHGSVRGGSDVDGSDIGSFNIGCSADTVGNPLNIAIEFQHVTNQVASRVYSELDDDYEG